LTCQLPEECTLPRASLLSAWEMGAAVTSCGYRVVVRHLPICGALHNFSLGSG